MKGETNNLQVARWTDDPAQQEEFLTEIGPRIKSQSKSMAHRYRVKNHWEDIASEIGVEFLQRMHKEDADGPFAKDSPKEAADFLLEKENYQIRERARSLARKEAKKQSRQAEILADVRQPDLSPEIETQLFAIAKSLPRITSEIPDFTPRDNDIARKEWLRQVGIDDLPAPIFDQVAQAAGISGSEEREYIKDHDENGHSSASDRKAWSRASAKVAKAFTRAKLASLLMLVFALSLALCSAIHQGRAIHQNAFVNQGSFTHRNDRARRGNLSHQNRISEASVQKFTLREAKTDFFA
jgi:hypothetical protein